ncbi:hypothetical protein MAP00_000695 [Monascus purpureus]|nr:hypothetical protein MAP00_000695 [Monascus purpureus]
MFKAFLKLVSPRESDKGNNPRCIQDGMVKYDFQETVPYAAGHVAKAPVPDDFEEDLPSYGLDPTWAIVYVRSIELKRCHDTSVVSRMLHWSHTFTLNKPALTRPLANLITVTSRSNKYLTIEDYCKMASGDKMQRNEGLFGRASKEMKEFILALQPSRIQLVFSELSEPKGTSKQSYYKSRSNYSGRSFKAGSSSKASSALGSGRKQKIGFADEDDGSAIESQIARALSLDMYGTRLKNADRLFVSSPGS